MKCTYDSKVADLVQVVLESVRGSPDKRDKRLSQEYAITIAPLILTKDDPADKYVNHLWYTIINQRRDVKDCVIPMMASLMLAGLNPDFIVKNQEEVKDIITAVLTSYGHEQKYSLEDNRLLLNDGYYKKLVASRSDAIIQTLKAIAKQYNGYGSPWDNLKDDFLSRRAQLMLDENLRKDLTQKWSFVGSKSLQFSLRDIEPILEDYHAIPIPVDSNVAQSIQKTGIMFNSWPPSITDVIPIEKRSLF